MSRIFTVCINSNACHAHAWLHQPPAFLSHILPPSCCVTYRQWQQLLQPDFLLLLRQKAAHMRRQLCNMHLTPGTSLSTPLPSLVAPVRDWSSYLSATAHKAISKLNYSYRLVPKVVRRRGATNCGSNCSCAASKTTTTSVPCGNCGQAKHKMKNK